MKDNKKLSPAVTKLFNKGRKLNVLLVFVSQSYFKKPNDIGLNATHDFIIKIPNKRKLQQIGSNYSSDIEFKDFMKLYKCYAKEPLSFLVNNATLLSDNQLRFRKKLL